MPIIAGDDPSASVLESAFMLNEKYEPNDEQEALIQATPDISSIAQKELEKQQTVRTAEVQLKENFSFKLRSYLVNAYEPNRLEASVKKLKFSEEMKELDKIMEQIRGDELELWELVRSSEEGEQNRTWNDEDLKMERADFTYCMVFMACRWAVDLKRLALLGSREINKQFRTDLLYHAHKLATHSLCNDWICALIRQNAGSLCVYVWDTLGDP
ncbi:hypothetical protein BS50DRAFT_677762 [Corynespora cassiicola Philippines]|uniref:Uncharacterized protein n=1 Tax=Corynespora cassiicola Philippines TaxID=1448308 RepID=A0A2T2NHE0_CORCC|nr:hypothetical protein BS50DRAFT_677762 [Corynespora cassiicola Philippines]